MDEGKQRSPANPLLLHFFLASPGDVPEERTAAREVIENLPNARWVQEKIATKVVAWEVPGAAVMEAGMTPQAAIADGMRRPSECDIVVVILWSRMGTPVPAGWKTKADGSPYRSGTEWEYLDALEAFQKTGRPTVLVYRRTEEVKISTKDPQRDEKNKQADLVEAFFADFSSPDGSLKGGYIPYETPAQFKEKLADDLSTLVVKRLGEEQRLESEQRPKEVDGARSALAELNTLGAIILNLNYFKSIADRLHQLYMDKDVKFLRSQPASEDNLKRAARSGDAALKYIRAMEEPKTLSDEQRTSKKDNLNELENAVKRLWAAAGVQQASGTSGAQSGKDAIEDFNVTLTLQRGSFNELAEKSWNKLGPWNRLEPGELEATLGRVRDKLSPSYPDYMKRVDQGYAALTGQPGLFVKCNHLIREYGLLEEALQELSQLMGSALDRPASACARIKPKVDKAKKSWDDFLGTASDADDWADSLLADGRVDWDEINTYWGQIDALLPKPDPSQPNAMLPKLDPNAFVSALQDAQTIFEAHLRAVDAALARAFEEVKNRLGEALMAKPDGVAA